MIRNLRGPAAAQVAIEQVAFHWLAKSGRSARYVYLPSRRKVQSAAHGIVDLPFAALGLKRLNIAGHGDERLFHLSGFTIHRSHGIHIWLLALLSTVHRSVLRMTDSGR